MPPLPGTETILIIDDETAVLSLTSRMLTRYGYETITATNAKETLHLFEVWPDLPVDLLLVDIVLPEMKRTVPGNPAVTPKCFWLALFHSSRAARYRPAADRQVDRARPRTDAGSPLRSWP